MSKIAPNRICEVLINDFINLAKQHLLTIKGQAVCTSQNISGATVPQIVNWTGYTCEPEQPSAVDDFVPNPQPTEFKTEAQLNIIELELLKANQEEVFATKYDVQTAPVHANKAPTTRVAQGVTTRFVASGAEARVVAERYLGRPLSDREWNDLIACTYAEANRDSEEEAWVAASILNRVRKKHTPLGPGNKKYAFDTVTDIIWQKQQYQAVTGWVGNGWQPSKNFIQGPPRKTELNIYGSIVKFMEQVPTNIGDFTSNNDCLYVKCKPGGKGLEDVIYPIERIRGINYDYLLKLRKLGGFVKGGTIFYY